MIRIARGIHPRALASQHFQRCCIRSSQDDDEVKKLRLLFVTRSMMPIPGDLGELDEKLAKGSVTPSFFYESVRQLMVSGRYRFAVDVYEKLVSEDEETGHVSTASVLNDATLLMLVHCYSSIGKMGPFVQICASLRDKRKYSPLFVERMIICFAHLDRLDVVEALLVEWLGRNLNIGDVGDDMMQTDWNEVLSNTLQDEKLKNSQAIGSYEGDLHEFMVPLLGRTSPKLGKRSKRSFLSSSKSAQFTKNLLNNLDVGTLSYSLPSIDVWKSVSRMYANRTAWAQCMQVSAVCFSRYGHEIETASHEGHTTNNERALAGIVHHTVRALCRSGQYLKALDYLHSSERSLGRRLRKAPTLALFLPYFHTHGSPAALQVVIDGVLDLIEEFIAKTAERSESDSEVVKDVELRGLISQLVSLLCRRGYTTEAIKVVEKLVESLNLAAEDNKVLASAKILRPSVLANLVNALAMRDDERAIALFRSLKFKEGPLARAMSGDGYNEAVDSAYHSLMGREKFLVHVSTVAEEPGSA